MKRLFHWFDVRLGISDTWMPMLRHPVPRELAGPMGWWYVFGSASLTLFALQILTGIGLALTYVPSAGQAYESLLYLNYQQPWGWFLRSLHYWSGSAMVVMVLVHMTQVFLHAGYKYPRELTWVIGVFLLLVYVGNGVHRPGAAVGSRCLLGRRRRRGDGRPCAGGGADHCRFAGGWADHRRRYAQPILCAACVCHPRRAASACWPFICGWC